MRDMLALRSLAIGSVLLGACGGTNPPPQSVENVSSSAPVEPVAQTTCYLGTSTFNEKPSEILLQHVVNPAKRQAIDMFTADSGDGYRDLEFKSSVADDGTYTLHESTLALTGVGRFTAGEPWEWTAWTSTWTNEEYKISYDLNLELHGEILTMSARNSRDEEFSVLDRYHAVPCAEYKARHNQLVLPKDQAN